jgi:hypothetical protein
MLWDSKLIIRVYALVPSKTCIERELLPLDYCPLTITQ